MINMQKHIQTEGRKTKRVRTYVYGNFSLCFHVINHILKS